MHAMNNSEITYKLAAAIDRLRSKISVDNLQRRFNWPGPRKQK
jgi:hypothetical protein